MLKESETVSKFLDYQRSRLRVARGTVANLAVGGPVLLLFLGSRTDATRQDLYIVAALLLGLLAAATTGAVSIRTAYGKRLRDAFDLLATEQHPGGVAGGAVGVDAAAAVCVRRRGEPEVLLVRTKGKQWIFPKGKPKNSDGDLAATALRELREEAGATGVAQPTAFTTFRYRKPGGDEQLVAAYLVLDAQGSQPDEKFRRPEWLSRDQAADRLGLGRTGSEAAELLRVLDEALALEAEHR